MLPRRIYINLVAFFTLFAILAFWAATNIVRPGLVRDSYPVRAEFADATGLRSGVEVTYRGVRVGEVGSIDLDDGGADVRLDIEADRELPIESTVEVRRRSAVGEPYVAIVPPAGPSADMPIMPEGHVVPMTATKAPLAYGELFDAADGLLTAIDGEDLRTVFSELAVAVGGRGDELRRLITSTADFTTTFASRSETLDRLAVELTQLTGTLADKSATIADSTDDVTSLVGSLSSSASDIEALLDGTPRLAEQVDALLDASYFQLQCGLQSSGAIASVVGDDETVRQIIRLLRAAETASVVIPKAIYEGPDGRYLGGTFGFSVDELVVYDEFPGFEATREVAPCVDGTAPVPGGLDDSAVSEGDASTSPGADGKAEDPGDGRQAGDDELASNVGDAEDGGGFPLLVLAAGLVLLAAAVTVATRLIGRWRATR
ncbi:MAG: MlaD family protein [Acidimicrobiales bacterium]|nr:MlaD family protein [Acidimicrobiales bacterium]